MRKGMQVVLGCLVVLALTGCSTPADVAKRDPILTLHSTKAVDVYLGCLAPKEMAEAPMSKLSPIPGGQQIIVSGSALGQVTGTVDVSADGNGSRIEVRKGAATDYAFHGTVENVKSCI